MGLDRYLEDVEDGGCTIIIAGPNACDKTRFAINETVSDNFEANES